MEKTIFFLGLVLSLAALNGCLPTSKPSLQNTSTTEKICGAESKGPNYGPTYCNRECLTNDDCYFDCGCGAININEQCHDEGIIYDCVGKAVRCENNRCIISN